MTMREKMARAISQIWLPNFGWDGANDGYRDQCYLMADAALNALLEPTEGMIAAYEKTGWPHDDGPEMPLAYQNMLRAAKEGK